MSKVREWFRNGTPQSLMQLLQRRRAGPAPKTSSLYVLQVDFPMTESLTTKMDGALNPLREKYGLDFIVLEPGMKLSRFDDI